MTRDEAAGLVIDRVLEREGGIAQVPGEAWVTRFGQTPQWLAEFGFKPPETAIEAKGNYLTWLVRTKLIGVCDLPDAFADAVIDYAVNSSHPTAIRALQRAVGVKPDGILGPETQTAIEQTARPRAARCILGAQMRLQGRLITDHPERFAAFAAGWANRLADRVETT